MSFNDVDHSDVFDNTMKWCMLTYLKFSALLHLYTYVLGFSGCVERVAGKERIKASSSYAGGHVFHPGGSDT